MAYHRTPFTTSTPWTVLINSGIKWISPKCFGTCRWYTCTETCWSFLFNVCIN